jgi:hypothetical protein
MTAASDSDTNLRWWGRSFAQLGVATVAGATWGLLTRAMSYSGSMILLDLASWPAIYVVTLALIAIFSTTAKRAAAIAVCVFLPFVITYYTSMFVEFHALSLSYAAIWLVASILAAPSAACLHDASQRIGWIPIVLSGLLASLTMIDGSLRALVHEGLQSHDLIQAFIDISSAVTIVAVWNRNLRSRFAACAAFLVLTALVLVVGSAAHYGVRS